ncbi:MAG: AI-2E family transporter [Planctomycetes bacterium]|nr:AI-2E family transporter [Planctomycetota bacterium]
MVRWASFIVLIAIILLVGALFFRILAGFLIPLFLAAILVVVFHPVHVRVAARWKRRPRAAAFVTTLIAMVTVLGPALFVVVFAAFEGASMMSQGRIEEIPHRLLALRTRLGLDIPHADMLRRSDAAFAAIVAAIGQDAATDPRRVEAAAGAIRSWEGLLADHDPRSPRRARLAAAQTALSESANRKDRHDREDALIDAKREYERFKTDLMGGVARRAVIESVNPSENRQEEWIANSVAAFRKFVVPVGGAAAVTLIGVLFGTCITAIALYFFLADGPAMLETVMRLSPLDDRYEQELLTEFTRVSRAVVLATLLSAVVQGVLAGVGYWFAGMGSVFLLTLLTVLVALIPFVGAATIWVPVSLWVYFVEERAAAAVLLALYGTVVVSLSDNLVKPWVLAGQSRLHPLLALLSILGGVRVMGPVGILVGPMVVVCLQVLLNILRRELGQPFRKAATGT